MLDFEALRDSTTNPAPNKGDIKKKRQATWNRLVSFGLSEQLMAETFGVGPRVVRDCQKQQRIPASHGARIAIDRLGIVINYMEVDLGLSDKAIVSFLTQEPMVLEADRDDGFYGQEDEGWDSFERSPLILDISSYGVPLRGVSSGLFAIEDRLKLRFASRQVEEQAGIVATPETIR